MDAQDLANSLFGKDRLEERELKEISTVNATAVSDSSNGYVKVRINEARTSSSNSGDEGSDVIELPTTPNVKEGDEVIVTCEGDTLKVMRVTDNIGSGDRAQTATDDARKVATNYIDIDENNGIIVGNMTEETLGKNSYIDADGFHVRDGETMLASFEDDDIYLGKNQTTDNKTAKVSFNNGAFYIQNTNKQSKGTSETDLVKNAIQTKNLSIFMNSYSSTKYAIDNFSRLYLYNSDNECHAQLSCGSGDNKAWASLNVALYDDSGNLSPSLKFRQFNSSATDVRNVSLEGHTHTTSDLTDVNTLAKAEHTHTKEDITDFTHTHFKSDITDFEHTHTKADITDFAHNHTGEDLTPDTIDATSTIKQAGTQVSLEGHTHNASDITDVKLYFEKGDTITVSQYCGGFITSSGKELYFSVPLNKPLVGVTGFEVTSFGTYQVRQNGKYVVLNKSPSSASAYCSISEQTLNIGVMFNSTDGATNNDACGIDVKNLIIELT